MKNKGLALEHGPLAWMADNPVAANLLMIVFLVGGLVMAMQIKQEVFPEFDMDVVSISVPYPGASPEEVEQGIILAVEEAVQGLEGVEKVTSTASEGSGRVEVEVLEGADIDRLSQEIQNEVDRITSFPDDAEEPVVTLVARKRRVISLLLYGDQPEKVLRETAERIRDELIQDSDITQVTISSARELEISVEVSQENLRKYGLTLAGIAQTIERAALELPGGSVKTAGGEILIRVKERRNLGQEFAKIPIITDSAGTQVLLEDIAVVRDGFEDVDLFAAYNGLPAIMIDVYRVGEQTPISVSDAVKKQVERVNDELHGMSLALRSDSSDVYKQRLDLLMRNGMMGLCLVFLLLAVFLESKLAFWVSMGIPISFMGAFIFLHFLGVSINMISMFAFIISLGIVVDDAIVVGENIYNHRQQGMSFGRAAVIGVREISVPVTFSVLTNIVAFTPMLFIPGTMGKIFKQIPIVVISVFLISLVESLLILPAHLAHMKDAPTRGFRGWLHSVQQGFSHWFIAMVNNFYKPMLSWLLGWRYLVVAVGLAVLVGMLSFVVSGRLGMTLFPKVESDYAYAEISLPYGTAVQLTQQVMQSMVRSAQKVAAENGGDSLVKGIYSLVGDSGSHKTSVRVYLTPPEERPISTGTFTNLWRAELGKIPGVESIVFRSDSGGPGSGDALTVELSHRNMKTLEEASAELAQALGNYSEARDIDDGYAPGKLQMDFRILPEARALGLKSADVARQVRNSFYGVEALRQQRERNEIRVMVRLPKEERVLEYNVEELMLRTPAGTEIPLREAVSIERGRSYTSINRRDGRRVVWVTADVVPQSKTNEILDDLKVTILPQLKDKYPGLSYSFEGKQADIRKSMSSLYMGLALAMLVIYAMLAVPFKSYSQPLIIMVCIPFGIVGAVLGHMIMGYSLSIVSMFGIVALSGVVVNDSLVLIDFANRRTKDGVRCKQAVCDAAAYRFRPILLTTLTTFGGLAPMILETSRQARFLIPMAISLGFGILFATVITLLLVPCLYLIVEDLRFGKRCGS